MSRLRRPLAAALAAFAVAAAPMDGREAAEPASVVLVAYDCASQDLVCPPFRQAARRTGTRARIISPDPREDIAGTFALLARQRHDLIVSDFDFAEDGLLAVAARFPGQRFAMVDRSRSRRPAAAERDGAPSSARGRPPTWRAGSPPAWSAAAPARTWSAWSAA